jgi:hypothetical protein
MAMTIPNQGNGGFVDEFCPSLQVASISRQLTVRLFRKGGGTSQSIFAILLFRILAVIHADQFFPRVTQGTAKGVVDTGEVAVEIVLEVELLHIFDEVLIFVFTLTQVRLRSFVFGDIHEAA